jgi:signal transduction histidine kinase
VTAQSLRLRLLAAAAIALVVALTVSGLVLANLFERHVEAREYAELRNHQNQIIAAVVIAANGQFSLANAPADPRFFSPNGGLYWQIELPGGLKQRSRSLWETELVLPADDIIDGTVHHHTIGGPNSSTLLAIERGVTVGPEARPILLRLTVAVDRRDLDTAAADFRDVLIKSLGVLGLALLAALLFQVQVGLRPLARLRTSLQQVHSGQADSVTGTFPSEIQPLIADMNALLGRERLNNARARERAADLAHGFKTPLAVLSAISRDLQRQGHTASASDVNAQIDIMGRHAQRELARARMVGATTLGQKAVAVRPLVVKIVAALSRISADRNLTWGVDAAEDVVFPGDENDLLELVGNLADNAAKWAAGHVRIAGRRSDQHLIIQVDDDGPGIPAGAEADILVRGRRLDENIDGSGLGLSIVSKIVDAYGGTLSLDRSVLGGLEVVVTLPHGCELTASLPAP